MDPMGYAYYLVLTPDELKTLRWMWYRGYDGDLIKNADCIQGEEGDDNPYHPGMVTLCFHESQAWEVHNAAEEDFCAFGACAAPELLAKMHAFIEALV